MNLNTIVTCALLGTGPDYFTLCGLAKREGYTAVGARRSRGWGGRGNRETGKTRMREGKLGEGEGEDGRGEYLQYSQYLLNGLALVSLMHAYTSWRRPPLIEQYSIPHLSHSLGN